MPSLPQVNATLVSIQPPGYAEDYDQAAGPLGDPIVTGPQDAYYIENVKSVFSQSMGALQKTRDVQLIIPADIIPTGTLPETGWVVQYIYRGMTHTRRVMDYVAKYLPGIPHPTIRFHLDPRPIEEDVDTVDSDD